MQVIGTNKLKAAISHSKPELVDGAVFDGLVEGKEVSIWKNEFYSLCHHYHNSPQRQQLLLSLLYGQAALQLPGNQHTWDLLIPVYLGQSDKPFNPQ